MTNKINWKPGEPITELGYYKRRDGHRFCVASVSRPCKEGYTILGYLDNGSVAVLKDSGRFNSSPNVTGADIVAVWEEPKPEPKKYDLSQMWKVWRGNSKGVYSDGNFFYSRVTAQYAAEALTEVLAITRADATSFYEGEGLEP